MARTHPADGPPVWQQYQRFKRQHPGALLLFRMGDFYETFDADAELVARELEIVLTSREMGKGQRHPLAGIPYHALDGGRRVAEELARIGPAEVLVAADDPRRGVPDEVPAELRQGFHLTPYDSWRFGEETAGERLRAHYRVATLDGFGCGDRPLAVR